MLDGVANETKTIGAWVLVLWEASVGCWCRCIVDWLRKRSSLKLDLIPKLTLYQEEFAKNEHKQAKTDPYYLY